MWINENLLYHVDCHVDGYEACIMGSWKVYLYL